MANELYWIRAISKAFGRPDANRALGQAFGRVMELGRSPEYEQGFMQFVRFMQEVKGRNEGRDGQPISSPAPVPFSPPPATRISIECDGGAWQTLLLASPPARVAVHAVKPGSYRLITDMGLVLWEGRLLQKDVFWAEAFPGQALPMAAQTEEARPRPSKTVPLLSGTVIMRIYPGLESGRMELEHHRVEQ